MYPNANAFYPQTYGYPFAGPAYPMAVFGADATGQPSTMDKIKSKLGEQNTIVPVKNSTLLGLSLAGALVVYGAYEGWFR